MAITHYAVVKTNLVRPIVVESERYESKAEFMTRIAENFMKPLADQNLDEVENFSIEIIFED